MGDEFITAERQGWGMKVFNSFQITVLFAVLPFIIQWTSEAQFKGHDAAFWALIVAYVISFGFNVAAWIDFMDKN